MMIVEVKRDVWRHWCMYIARYYDVESIMGCRMEIWGTWIWDLALCWTLMMLRKMLHGKSHTAAEEKQMEKSAMWKTST